MLLVPSAAWAAQPLIQCIERDRATGSSAATIVDGLPLVHTWQFGPEESGQQPSGILAELDKVLAQAGASLDTTAKLNIYLADTSSRELWEKTLAARFTGEHAPAVAYVTTKLDGDAPYSIDAVAVMTKGTVDKTEFPAADEILGVKIGLASASPPSPRYYISGQAVKGNDLLASSKATLADLDKTLKAIGRSRTDVLQVKCFFTPMDRSDEVIDALIAFFDGQVLPPMVMLGWDSTVPIEIELIVGGGAATSGAPNVEYITPEGMKASPVFCRVVKVNDPRTIYVSGVYADDPQAAPEAQVREIFGRLKSAVEPAGSDLRHLVKATYYVVDKDVETALGAVRPEFYDPARPPAASKARVVGAGRADHRITLDMIAVPAR
jgi:enamine deaminase RidA (YjgF/YER057c/UK114 family)